MDVVVLLLLAFSSLVFFIQMSNFAGRLKITLFNTTFFNLRFQNGGWKTIQSNQGFYSMMMRKNGTLWAIWRILYWLFPNFSDSPLL
jgi:hypothetical protein